MFFDLIFIEPSFFQKACIQKIHAAKNNSRPVFGKRESGEKCVRNRTRGFVQWRPTSGLAYGGPSDNLTDSLALPERQSDRLIGVVGKPLEWLFDTETAIGAFPKGTECVSESRDPGSNPAPKGLWGGRRRSGG